MLNELSWWRAMPIGLSCLLHAGLVAGLVLTQPWMTGMVAPPPPVLPVQLVTLLADGRIGDVLVERSAGHPDLDQAAMEAVRRWRFEPARRAADAVAMWVLLPVQFPLTH